MLLGSLHLGELQHVEAQHDYYCFKLINILVLLQLIMMKLL